MTRRAILTSLLGTGRKVHRTVSGLRGGVRPVRRARSWLLTLHRLAWPWRRSQVTGWRAAAFGSRLQATRERARLTQEELARRAGIGLDFYRRLETGDPAALNGMTVDLLWLVTDALGTSPRELFEGLDCTASATGSGS